MIIQTTNILAWPLIMLVWLVDVYLLNAGLHLLLSKLSATRTSALCLGLGELITPLPRWVGRKMSAWRYRPVPHWAPWVVVIAACVITRHALLMIVVAMS